MPNVLPGGPLRHLVYPLEQRNRRASSFQVEGKNQDWWPCESGATLVLADLSGPGCINHIWLTSGSEESAWTRKMVIRIYWNGAEYPSVEAPLGDFFGCGHGIIREYESIAMSMAGPDNRNRTAFNCWLPMPYAHGARIEVTNEGELARPLYFYVDYEEYDVPLQDAMYFHAVWHREIACNGWADASLSVSDPVINGTQNLSDADNYLILQTQGRGTYIGCNLSIDNTQGEWWGEGDDMIFIDEEPWPPSLHGTGTEDYFGHAYGMQDVRGLYNGTSVFNREHTNWEGKWTVYRWHVPDPIAFQKSLRVSIEHGHANSRSDDYSSTAYWYQTQPTPLSTTLPPVSRRLPNDS